MLMTWLTVVQLLNLLLETPVDGLTRSMPPSPGHFTFLLLTPHFRTHYRFNDP